MEHHGPTSWLLRLPLLSHNPEFIHVNGAILVFLFILFLSLVANAAIRKNQEVLLIPSKRFSIPGFIDMLVEFLQGLVVSILGDHGMEHFSMIAAVFIFVLFSNLLGILPLSSSPSANLNTTLALGLSTFVYYNAMGIRAHGFVGYVKHFLMGLGIMGIPIALFEVLSHVLRPGTLALRLFLNLTIDHLLAGSFASLCAWLLPVPLLLFGIVVCTIQAFLFAVLTAVYVQMATEHDGH